MHACLEGALSFLAAPSWQLTPPANLDATASPGLPLIGTRTPRLQNSRRSCARTILQESARKCAHSCILCSAIRQTTKSKKEGVFLDIKYAAMKMFQAGRGDEAAALLDKSVAEKKMSEQQRYHKIKKTVVLMNAVHRKI